MTPNLFLATQKVFQPHKWFRSPRTDQPTRVTEYWTTPKPGQYEYIPGRGWYLIATLVETSPNPTLLKDLDGVATVSVTSSEPQEFTKLPRPIPVHRSRVLGRYLLEEDYKNRKKTATIQNENGKRVQAGFFQLDNGIAWVHCWDDAGIFIPGGKTGYKLWCIDPATKEFRHMRKGDDPSFTRSRHTSRDRNLSRPSQDSISTGFRSGPGTPRDGPSAPSTRANSIRGGLMSNPTSTPSSRGPSRRNSPRRNDSIPLEEAKAALRRMAKEQEDAVLAAAAASRTRKVGSNGVVVSRGRPLTRVV
ncbi:hypothetical protein GQ44DRAFT_680700 [Phaeosphaeriaceae sp. PMI808]|nr:hypothetical protein GQ44DRAFT_680700 [Phaeosphaeriaceae sp. PMI808]